MMGHLQVVWLITVMVVSDTYTVFIPKNLTGANEIARFLFFATR